MLCWSTECSRCDWAGCVPLELIARGCPKRESSGRRCGAPFVGTPPDMIRRPSPEFYRPMTELESGEWRLLQEWWRIPVAWVPIERGGFAISRPRPASWDTEESEAKTRALWDILGRDPFPVPEVVAMEEAAVVDATVIPVPRALPPPSDADEVRDALDQAEYFRGLVESAPPPERKRQREDDG